MNSSDRTERATYHKSDARGNGWIYIPTKLVKEMGWTTGTLCSLKWNAKEKTLTIKKLLEPL